MNWRPKLLAAILILAYLVTRLYHLGDLAITNDEANYIFWAKQIATTNHGWFITLTAGKPPVFLWFIVFFLKILPGSAFLIAGRLPSVLSGLVSLVGIYKLAKFLFKTKLAGFISMAIYLLCPFILFYDRLALYDSFLMATLIWSVYFAFKRNIVKWGLAMGLSLLAKPTALMYLGLLPVLFLYNSSWKRWRTAIVAVVIALFTNSFLLFSSGLHDYVTRALGYTPSPGQLVLSPLALIGQNLSLTASWLSGYLTFPFIVLAVISSLFLVWKNPRLGLTIISLWLFPLLAFLISARIYFPRYFLFVVPFMLLPIGYLVSKRLMFIAFVLALIPIINYDYLLLAAPAKAPLPAIEKWQFVNGYPSASGFEPVYAYLDKTLEKQTVTLFVHGSFSHYPHAFDLYYWGNPRIKIIERLPLNDIDPEMEAAKQTSAAFLVYGTGVDPTNVLSVEKLGLTTVAIGDKPAGVDKVYLATYK